MKNPAEEKNEWYKVANISDIPSPSLLIYPDRIEHNIREMIAIAGDPARLRPHVKTYKMKEVINLQMKHSITRFKCATIAEAEMTASCGAEEILLAIQPVGPNIKRFIQLKKAYPGISIACIADSEIVIRELAEQSMLNSVVSEIYIDINIGMNRTGICPGEEAVQLFRLITSLPGLKPGGLHVYDGHIRNESFSERKQRSDSAFRSAEDLILRLNQFHNEKIKVVAGGTPTFPVHALRESVELSPGTTLLWDHSSSATFSDIKMQHAAVLLARVISKPADNLLCLDLGHKAVASEMPQPRVKFFGIDDFTVTGHSEEHMVIKTNNAKDYKTGDAIFGIPVHICPTVDRYDKVFVISGGLCTGEWEVSARRRKITI
jgi:D-serine deaminase-like pyridoxal phosphate-dependent protein